MQHTQDTCTLSTEGSSPQAAVTGHTGAPSHGVTINTTLHKKYKSKCQLGREVLSEELGLQKLLKGREGRPCSGSAG